MEQGSFVRELGDLLGRRAALRSRTPARAPRPRPGGAVRRVVASVTRPDRRCCQRLARRFLPPPWPGAAASALRRPSLPRARTRPRPGAPLLRVVVAAERAGIDGAGNADHRAAVGPPFPPPRWLGGAAGAARPRRANGVRGHASGFMVRAGGKKFRRISILGPFNTLVTEATIGTRIIVRRSKTAGMRRPKWKSRSNTS